MSSPIEVNSLHPSSGTELWISWGLTGDYQRLSIVKPIVRPRESIASWKRHFAPLLIKYRIMGEVATCG